MLNSSRKIKVVDLCAGTGAFSLGFKNYNNVEVVFANDILPESKIIYEANMGHELHCSDLLDLDLTDIPSHDILTCGFPCQPFSIAGNKRGFNDTRSNIFWKLVSIIQYHKPTIFILENVKNLLTHDKGNTFKIIYDSLVNLNYHIKYDILDTAKISGIPQHRERLFICGFLNKEHYDKFSFNFASRPINLVSNYLEYQNVHSKYYYNDNTKIGKIILTSVNDNTKFYQYRRYYVRENKNNLCPTLTANMGSGGHNVPIILESNGVRKLTPRECFNLQGFPSTYDLCDLSDNKLYKLAGNAISLPIIILIYKQLSNIILLNYSSS